MLTLFDFETLLQASALINCITLCLEMAALLRLRYTEPETERPYTIPGGLGMAWFITVVLWLVVLLLFVLVCRDAPWYLLVNLGFTALTVVVYWFYLKHQDKKGGPLMSEMSTVDAAKNIEAVNVSTEMST